MNLVDVGAEPEQPGSGGSSLNPFAGFRDAITPEESADPEVHNELQRRFRVTILFATIGTLPTAVGFATLLWFIAPSPGVIVWLVATLTNLILWPILLRRPVSQEWIRSAFYLQLYGGIVWGSLPLLAMPQDEQWQIFLGAFGMGVQASSVLFAAQIRRLFYAFHIPNFVLSVTGFVLLADGAGFLGAALLGYAGVFAAGLSEIHHLTALSASTFSIRASRLASGLSAKSEALTTANRQLAEQARTDPLTSLANRFDFDRRLELALGGPAGAAAGGPVVVVAMLDLDRFKAVNDSLGHRVGDLLLVAVADRLRRRLAADELLARFGGDELVVLSPALAPGIGPPALGQRLLSAFDDPFNIDGRRLEVGASIGVVDSSTSTRPGDLLRFADAALYEGKRLGGGRVEVFDAELRDRLRERRVLEEELAVALGQGQLVPYLQPFVDVRTGAIIGAEALARWLHPDGIRSAGVFFDAVEELGLVDELTDRLLQELTAGRLANPALAGLPISVNVAPDHLQSLVEQYEGSEVLTGLMLEITEQARFVESTDGANELIARARATGARILLDDFGIGFSSLARAAKLDVDGYKLDRLFVAELGSCADSRAVLAGAAEIASRQGRELIGEGVETSEQARILAEFGVRTLQGFLYSPALPLEEVARLVADGHRYPAMVRRGSPAQVNR